MRAKALGERAVRESSLPHTIFSPSFVYAPGDPYLRLLQRMSWLPLMAIPGIGRAAFEPMWAEDVADCVMAALAGESDGLTYELAGPDVLTQREIVEIVLGSVGRRRRVVGVPSPVVRRLLGAVELLMGPTAFATWDEAQLLDITMTSQRGTADAERLGVRPRPMATVLGVG
jgi:NADH dehydrogenase